MNLFIKQAGLKRNMGTVDIDSSSQPVRVLVSPKSPIPKDSPSLNSLYVNDPISIPSSPPLIYGKRLNIDTLNDPDSAAVKPQPSRISAHRATSTFSLQSSSCSPLPTPARLHSLSANANTSITGGAFRARSTRSPFRMKRLSVNADKNIFTANLNKKHNKFENAQSVADSDVSTVTNKPRSRRRADTPPVPDSFAIRKTKKRKTLVITTATPQSQSQFPPPLHVFTSTQLATSQPTPSHHRTRSQTKTKTKTKTKSKSKTGEVR